MNQAQGLSAWRWLFIIEGAPSLASAFLVWFILPDYPESASWLSEEEKTLAAQRLAVEGSKGGAKAMTWQDAKEILLDWRLYAHYLVSNTGHAVNEKGKLLNSAHRSTSAYLRHFRVSRFLPRQLLADWAIPV
jgi:hypothetical protein